MIKEAKKFIRGFFDKGQYSDYSIKLHKDFLNMIKNGEWKPVGDYYNFKAKQKRDGSGFYLEVNEWDPKTAKPKANANGTTDDLPF